MKILSKGLLATGVIVFMFGLFGSGVVFAAGPAAVDLLTADNFTILSKTGITNTGSHTTSITGNIGSSPITAAAMDNVFCSEITGTIYGVDAAYTGSGATTCFAGNPGVPAVVPPDANKTLVDNAVLDMGTAYTDAAGRTLPDGTNLYGGNIGGQTFAPGLYKWTTDVTIPTSVTLSGGASDVWIFQIAGNLDVAAAGSIPAGVKVILSGGAQASNVFWQVGGLTGATLGTYSTFNGTILSAKQVIMQTGAVLNGRALAQTQVTLDANTLSSIVVPVPGITPVGNLVGGGGELFVPLIGLLNVPDPLALPGGSAPVTYNYTVWNVGGKQALKDITLTDDKCSAIKFVSGDTNNNNKIDPGEYWKYTCTRNVSRTTTNVAYVAGYSDDAYRQTAIATAIATVVVSVPSPSAPTVVVTPLPAPLISMVKVPSRLTPFPYGGGEVAYIYAVTNPGVVAMNDVSVMDDKCGPVARVSGDTNANGLLDVGETWLYSCKSRITVSTRNTAIARGRANGFTAIGYAYGTVLVAAPGLPNTGVYDDKGVTRAAAIAAFHRSLGIGSHGADVEVLQTVLEAKGLLTMPQGVAKGYFGNLTRKAVEKYQQEMGLPMVGIFGPQTRAKITSELGE